MIGECFLKLNDFTKSIDYLKKSSKLFNNKDIKSIYSLGMAHMKLKNYENAAKIFKSGIKLDPDYAMIHYQLIDIYHELNKFREAKKECDILYMLDRKLFYTSRFCN